MSERVIVFGSRDWRDEAPIYLAISKLPKEALVIVGGAPGADKIAEKAARESGRHAVVVQALWDHFGKAAGPIRNGAMMDLQPTRGLGFHKDDSPGTANMIRRLRNANVPCEVVKWTRIEQGGDLAYS